MADLSRRQFAATSTAAVATALIPEAPAKIPNLGNSVADIVKPAALADRDFWYLHETKSFGDGIYKKVSGSKLDPHEKRKDRIRVLRRRFVPLATDARFRLFFGKYHDYCHDYPDGWYELPEEAKDAFFRASFDSIDWSKINPPASYVQLFYGLGQIEENYLADVPFVTRSSGLSIVAKHNRKAWDAVSVGEDYTKMPWAALLEYAGPFEERGVTSVTLSSSGVGVDDQSLDYPVRLAIPTAEELARFAVKGGDTNE